MQFAPTIHIPEWDDLPPGFRALLEMLRRWAHTMDGTHLRCPRRLCRSSGHCMVSSESLAEGCGGEPSPRVADWITGMWAARTLDLVYECDPDEGGPA